MSKAAFSLRVFSIYLFALGASLVLAPNLVLSILAIEPTHEVWLRVAGMLAAIISFYYFMASAIEMREFYRWTAYARLSVLVFFIAFVLLGLAPPVLILIGVVDAAAALWTLSCLGKESSAGS